MSVWIALICLLGIISIVTGIVWRRTRRLDWQIRVASKRLSGVIRSRRRSSIDSDKLLKDIYALITKAINSNDQRAVYKAVDVLKLALGEKIMRPDEPVWLMSLTVAAIKAKEVDSAAIILEAFRPMIRQMACKDMKMAAEQLTLIGAVALREKQPFIVAKISEDLFSLLERINTNDVETVLAALKAIRSLGLIVLRRKETALFREINVRLINWASNDKTESIANEVIHLYSAWLYRIVKSNNESMFNILVEFVWRLLEANHFKERSIMLLLKELSNASGMAALNPYSPLAGFIIDQMLLIAVKQQQSAVFLAAVRGAGYVIRLSITQHGIKTAFSLIYYLLETGRKMFVAELKFGKHSDGYRRNALLQLLKEVIAILTYSSRQDICYTTGDIIADVYKYWLSYPKVNDAVFINEKSVKKFCQLILLYWLRTKRHPEKNLPRDTALVEPMLLSENEKRQLGFFELTAEV